MKIKSKILYSFATLFVAVCVFSFVKAANAASLTFTAPGTQSASVFNSTPSGGQSGSWSYAGTTYNSGAGNWTVSAPSPSSGAAGAQGNSSFNVTVTGTPPATGSYSATLTFSGTNMDPTQNTLTVYYQSAGGCSVGITAGSTNVTSGGSTTVTPTASGSGCGSLTLSGGIFNNSSANSGQAYNTGGLSSTTTYIATDSATGNTAQVTVNVSGSATCTINVDSTGTPGNFSYFISGPASFSGNNNNSYAGKPAGNWTINYNNDSSATFTGYTPAQSQTCSSGGSITFTLNFTSPSSSCTINVNHTGNPSSFTWALTPTSGSDLTGTNDQSMSAPIGSWTASGGAPSGYTLQSISPTATQNCTAGGTITYTYNFVVAGPGDPGNPTVENSSINPSVACGQIKITWTAGSNASSYNLYRSTNASSPGSVWQTTTSLTYTDTSSSNGTTYYYWVQSVNSSGTSSLVGSTGINATACKVDLSTSGKYVSKVNNVPYPYTSACTTAPSGTSKVIKKGDRLEMRIEVCNTGTANANNVSLNDDIANFGTNLTVSNPPNVSFVGGTSPSYTQSGNALTFNLGTIAVGSKAVITFNVDVTSTSTAQTLLRFRNVAKATYTSSAPAGAVGCVGSNATSANPCVLDTGYIVFYNGLKAPTIIEVNP